MLSPPAARCQLRTKMTIPDWQLPPGVDRGLWDYLHAAEMVAGYDQQMKASHLARADVRVLRARLRRAGKVTRPRLRHRAAVRPLRGEGLRVRRRGSVGRDARNGACADRRPSPRPPPPGERGRKHRREDRLRAREERNRVPKVLLPSPPGGGGRGEGFNVIPEGEPRGVGAKLPERSFDFAACLFSTLGMVARARTTGAGTGERVPRAEARRAVRAPRPQSLLPRAGLEARRGAETEDTVRKCEPSR